MNLQTVSQKFFPQARQLGRVLGRAHSEPYRHAVILTMSLTFETPSSRTIMMAVDFRKLVLSLYRLLFRVMNAGRICKYNAQRALKADVKKGQVLGPSPWAWVGWNNAIKAKSPSNSLRCRFTMLKLFARGRCKPVCRVQKRGLRKFYYRITAPGCLFRMHVFFR